MIINQQKKPNRRLVSLWTRNCQFPKLTSLTSIKEKNVMNLQRLVSYKSLVNVTFLEVFKDHREGSHSLTHLRRNMPLWELPTNFGASDVNDQEALIIAETMKGVQRLDLAFNRLSDTGVDAILIQWKALTHLEIQGCWNMELKGDVEERCEKLVEFRNPWIGEHEDSLADSSDIDKSSEDECDEESIYSESPSSSDLD